MSKPKVVLFSEQLPRKLLLRQKREFRALCYERMLTHNSKPVLIEVCGGALEELKILCRLLIIQTILKVTAKCSLHAVIVVFHVFMFKRLPFDFCRLP